MLTALQQQLFLIETTLNIGAGIAHMNVKNSFTFTRSFLQSVFDAQRLHQ